MRYMLRSVILEKTWERQLQDIVRLCKETGIGEVLLKEVSSHIMPVPEPLTKHHRMASIYRRMAQSLRANGIEYSINIIMLAGHCDAEIGPDYILPYQKFVGEDLRELHANYCLIDNAWQAYAAEVCAIYAATHPAKILIDDDFRSVNHTIEFGCFCPIHVARTAERCGITLTAEQLLRAVSGQSAEDLHIKEAWMQVNFEGQLEAARKIRIAVEAVSPQTRVGLMNSGEPAHSFQGRDMDRLLREFAGEKRPFSRPAGCSYSDAIHGDLFRVHQVMALSKSVLGDDIQIASEVENYPHTRYGKGIRTTRTQMRLHALAGADNFTLNLYDYLATPYEQEPDYQQLLIEEKSILSKIQEARKGKRMRGFGIPWRQNAALKQTSRRGEIRDVLPEREFDIYFPQFGIPVQFVPAQGNLLFGDTVQCYDDEEVFSLLTGGMLLDGQALEHLHVRGFGRYLGCELEGRLDGPTVEKFGLSEFTGRFGGNMQTTHWFETKREGKVPYRVKPDPGAEVLSMILDENLNELAPGAVLFENELGGRIAVLTVPVTSFQFLHRCRAYMIAKISQWLMKEPLPIWIEDCPNIGPIYYEGDDGEGLLGIVSGNLDSLDVKLHTDFKLFDLFTGERCEQLRMEPLSARFFRTIKN